MRARLPGSVSDIERENVTDTESDSDSSGAEYLETEMVTDFGNNRLRRHGIFDNIIGIGLKLLRYN